MGVTLDEALERAVKAHRVGQIQEADRIYTAILQAQPKHPDANHNMGVLAVGVGQIEDALPFFKAALEANHSIGQYWLSYTDALMKLGRIAEAKTVFDQAKDKGVGGEKFDQLEQKLAGQELQDPPSGKLQTIIDLYTQGQLQQALSESSQMLVSFPNSVTLLNLVGASNAGLMQFRAAIDSYKQALKIKPNYADTYYNLGNALYDKGDLEEAIESYNEAVSIKPDYAEAYNNLGNVLTDKGDFEAGINCFTQALKIEPNYHEAYNNIGNALRVKGNEAEALDSYEQALRIKPDYADVHNNIGIVLNNRSDSDAAIKSYKQALKIKPDYAEVYNNMGIAFRDMGDFDAAINSYKQALSIKPDYAEVYNNMGVVLDSIGDPEAAIESYKQALKLNPNFAEAKLNLLKLLTSYTSQIKNENLIVVVNTLIRHINIENNISKIITDNQVTNLVSKSLRFIDSYGLELKIKDSQTYRRNSVDLNCKRHMSIFKEHGIISEFCFGCYKVQVEPRSIIELIKLYFIFDQLELDENNTRKCTIELRPEISGFYKGLIYCSNLEEAYQIANYIEILVKENIGSKMNIIVKRGCSEYPIAFPDYKEINRSENKLMKYNEKWKLIEEDYDLLNPLKSKRIITPTLTGLNLQDILIIRNWIDYAKGIGDPSVHLLKQNTIFSQKIFNKAKTRLGKYKER